MWVADYVLMEYGTGAIMAVPGHDAARLRIRRRKFGLEIRRVIEGGDGAALHRATARSSTPIRASTGCRTARRSTRSSTGSTARAAAHRSVNYRLRDWLLSRQRYWGCPIPVVHCDDCGLVPVPDDQLPVLLPDVTDYKPKGRSPLADRRGRGSTPRARSAAGRRCARPTRWTRSSTRRGTSCATATPATTRRRGIRRSSPRWAPVDQYIGGVEHAILHLMYARFFVKALADMGLVARAGAVQARSSRRG